MGINVKEYFTPEGLPCVEITGCNEFEPAHIFECGQCFRWNHVTGTVNTYVGVAGGRVLAVSSEMRTIQHGDADSCPDTCSDSYKVITLANTDARGFEEFWRDYFDFERDYADIQSRLSEKDEYIKSAMEHGRGIRILRQEPFETLISFIISANNNIPRIKGCVERLCEAYGERIEPDRAFSAYISRLTGQQRTGQQSRTQTVYYTFPTPEKMSHVSASEISDCCKAGYRCAYIEKTSRTYIDTPIDTASISSGAIEDARKALRSYTGVGPKVADCVLLFAGLRTDVFPVDVWVRRVLERLYFKREISVAEGCAFVNERFGNLAGYAQQYLFYGMREDPSIFDNIT